MTSHPPKPDAADDHRARRVGYRLDWCASVELILDNRPDLSLIAAVDLMATIYPNPFETFKAFRVFYDRNRGEVSTRKPEIWQHLEYIAESAHLDDDATESVERELSGVIGVRVTERYNGLGLTHVPPGPKPNAPARDQSPLDTLRAKRVPSAIEGDTESPDDADDDRDE